MTKTVDLRETRSKLKQLCDALDGTLHLPNGTAALATYHHAKAAVNGTRRVGTERRFNAIRAALKQHAVMVSMHSIDDLSCVRVHVPAKKIDIIL